MFSNADRIHKIASKNIESVQYRKSSGGRRIAGTWVFTILEQSGTCSTHNLAQKGAKELLDSKIIKWYTQFPGEVFNKDTANCWDYLSYYTGIYIIHMIGSSGAVDHTIAQNCKLRIIYDSEKLYDICNTTTAVLACLSGDSMIINTLCSAKRSNKLKEK